MKPILKWAGGKHRIREKIFGQFPSQIKNYWEPFLGSASLALEVYQRTNANLFLSDINNDLIYFYQHVKDKNELLRTQILELKTIFGLSDWLDAYLNFRRQFNASPVGSLERSALFYFLNKTSFNGLTRYNSKGKFNVPFGKRDFIPDTEEICRFGSFLNDKRVHICHRDYLAIAPEAGDMVYLDPPYHPLNKTSSFTSYHTNDWNESNELELKEFCDKLTNQKTFFIVSNNDVEFMRNLFAGYEFVSLEVRKSVGAKKETRKLSGEIFILNALQVQNPPVG